MQGSTCAIYITLGRCVVRIIYKFSVCYSAVGGTLDTYFLDLLLVSAHFSSLIVQISSQFSLLLATERISPDFMCEAVGFSL